MTTNGDDNDDDGGCQYSVCVFYPDESYEYVARYVDGLTAVQTFKRMTECVGARCGLVRRVIVTDGGDCINMEWKFGPGHTYPPELVARTSGPRQ